MQLSYKQFRIEALFPATKRMRAEDAQTLASSYSTTAQISDKWMLLWSFQIGPEKVIILQQYTVNVLNNKTLK